MNTVNVLYPINLLSERIKILRIVMGCPVLSTFFKAVNNGNFVSFPGHILAMQFMKYLKFLVPSQLGYMTQER